MTVFLLSNKNLSFPPPEYAERDGLLAVGGDLGVDRLLRAYSLGIFPWYSEGYPILWWSPDPRLVLLPEELKISRSLRQVGRKGLFRVMLDTAFDEVVRHCAEVHRNREGETWITKDMRAAYMRLHEEGLAHSVESWHEDELVGGLYGVSLGGAFFGESMFTLESNASKVAFVKLVELLMEWNFKFVDCQVKTTHLVSLGAREVPRKKFMKLLKEALKMPTKRGRWTGEVP